MTKINKQTHVYPLSNWILIAIGIFATLFLYVPNLNSRLFSLDDSALILAPQIVTPPTLASIKTILTPGAAPDYYPAMDLSFMIDHQFFGSWIPYYRIHQLGIFGGIMILIFLFFWSCKVPGWLSISLTMFWGLNPFHAETICWLSGRKDLLALFFGMGGILLFLRATNKNAKYLYFLSVAAFVLSIMSKASLIALPLTGLLIVFYGPRKFKKNEVIITLLIGISITLCGSIFFKWYYSAVNDVRQFYPLNYRIEASAAAFAKMMGGWLVPKWNIVDTENWGDWLSNNRAFIFPGFVLWLFLFGLTAVSKFFSWKGIFVASLSFLLLYAPISGLVFYHRQLYSARYVEPCFLEIVIATGILLSNFSHKLSKARVRTIKIIVFFLLCILADATANEARIWRDPIFVIKKGLRQQPNSISLKILLYKEYIVLSEHGISDETIITEKSSLHNDIEFTCSSNKQEVQKPCSAYWMAELNLLNSRIDDKVANEFIEKATIKLTEDPESQAVWNAAARLAYRLSRGEIDTSTAKIFSEKSHWKIVPILRLLDWVSKCQLDGSQKARIVMKEYLDQHLLIMNDVSKFLTYAVHSKNKLKLQTCLPD